jgi:leucyl aminopeptidase
MSSPAVSLPIACSRASLEAVEADLVVVPWFEHEGADAVPALQQASGDEVGRALSSGEFTGRAYEWFMTPVMGRPWRARRLALVGAGPRDGFTTLVARQVATAAALAARQRRTTRVAILLRAGSTSASGAALAQAFAEGLALGEFDAASYKTGDRESAPFPACTIVLPADLAGSAAASLEAAVTRGLVLGECCNLTRGMCNEPSNTLTPVEFARRSAEMASAGGISVETLDARQMASLGMGLLLGVAKGSSEPPRLTVFRHEPPGAPQGPVLGLIGKGVTFDSGGISIKPANGMEKMKDDMSGGAAVAGAMRAIGLLQAPVRVIGIVPAVENMPGGRALKPGDVVRSAEGKTVEVINTDAEGRLILGDALWYARQLGATHLVDVATLTGGVVVALGRAASGMFGTPDSWVDHVGRVANAAGDRVWRLPLYDEYRDQLRSEIADLSNIGGRAASSCTAAMFLKEFTGGLPWVHLDIAGTAWIEDAKPYAAKGPTGVATRALAELAFSMDAWSS